MHAGQMQSHMQYTCFRKNGSHTCLWQEYCTCTTRGIVRKLGWGGHLEYSAITLAHRRGVLLLDVLSRTCFDWASQVWQSQLHTYSSSRDLQGCHACRSTNLLAGHRCRCVEGSVQNLVLQRIVWFIITLILSRVQDTTEHDVLWMILCSYVTDGAEIRVVHNILLSAHIFVKKKTVVRLSKIQIRGTILYRSFQEWHARAPLLIYAQELLLTTNNCPLNTSNHSTSMGKQTRVSPRDQPADLASKFFL